MKLYIAALLIGLIVSPSIETIQTSQNEIEKEENCINLPPLNNFDPKKYFKGKWYFTYGKNFAGKTNNIICEESKSEILDNGLIRTLSTAYIDSLGTFLNSETFLNPNEIINGTAKFTGASRILQADGKKIISNFMTVPYMIIDTDYDNYSIQYFCFNLEGIFKSELIIDVRDRNDTKIDKKIEAKLYIYGLKLKDFSSSKGVACRVNPDF